MKPTRPALRFHGGKWKLAPWIIGFFVPHHTYVETHGGAASILLQKDRSKGEVYNDIDGEIVNFFRVLRTSPGVFAQQLMDTPYAADEYKLSFEHSVDPVEQARRTAIRSFMGWGSNSLSRISSSSFRTLSNDRGTTAAQDWMTVPDRVMQVADRFRGVIIDNQPAENVIDEQDCDQTLFYVDPPYEHATRSLKSGKKADGYTHEMTDKDHRKLAKRLHAVEGMVVVSCYPSPLYDKLYRGWEMHEIECKALTGAPRIERVYLNPKLSGHHDKFRLFPAVKKS